MPKTDLAFFDETAAFDDHDDIADNKNNAIHLSHTVLASETGMRLDKLTSMLFADFSRASLQKYIEMGDLTVNGAIVKPKYSVRAGDVLSLNTTLVQHSDAQPENIALTVMYEDDCVLVVNKPAGMVVHPAVGNWTGTLVNALLYHYPALSHLPRAGIVHRIDKDTSGLLMVAKTAAAQLNLIAQLKEKSVYRHYQCVVMGEPALLAAHKTINAPIARHLSCRTKMAIIATGKPAVTHIQQITPLADGICLLDIALETGRTHQIRVHLSSKGFPLVGDKTYTAPTKKRLPHELHALITQFPRQALHAYRLGFVHPSTNKAVEVTAPLPSDMQDLIGQLTGQ